MKWLNGWLSTKKPLKYWKLKIVSKATKWQKDRIRKKQNKEKAIFSSWSLKGNANGKNNNGDKMITVIRAAMWYSNFNIISDFNYFSTIGNMLNSPFLLRASITSFCYKIKANKYFFFKIALGTRRLISVFKKYYLLMLKQ